MTAALARRRRSLPGHVGLRWAASLMLVIAFHAAALLTLRRTVPALGIAVPEAILIDLAPEVTPAVDPTPPAQKPVDPTPMEPTPVEPTPVEPTPVGPTLPDPMPPEPTPRDTTPPVPVPLQVPDTALPVPQAEVPLPPALPPRPRPRPRSAAVQPNATPPHTAAPVTAPPPAAPAASAPAGQVPATWESAVVAHLARFRRFPPAAQRRGEQGVVLMRVTLTRAGIVLAMDMVRGSGYEDLDEEAAAWLTRAAPLPAVPTEITGQQVQIVVPLRFTLR